MWCIAFPKRTGAYGLYPWGKENALQTLVVSRHTFKMQRGAELERKEWIVKLNFWEEFRNEQLCIWS